MTLGKNCDAVLSFAREQQDAFTALSVIRALKLSEPSAKGAISDLVRDGYLQTIPTQRGFAVKYRCNRT